MIIQTFAGKRISLWKLRWYSRSVNPLKGETCGAWLVSVFDNVFLFNFTHMKAEETDKAAFKKIYRIMCTVIFIGYYSLESRRPHNTKECVMWVISYRKRSLFYWKLNPITSWCETHWQADKRFALKATRVYKNMYIFIRSSLLMCHNIQLLN